MKTAALSLFIPITAILFTTAKAGAGEQAMPANCPLHAQHMQQAQQAAPPSHDGHAEMLARGGRAMGFDQLATSHHFRLSRSGGAIEVHVNNPQDAQSIAAIATHLGEIAVQFSRGDFGIPLQVHGEKPAGVDALTQQASAITYTFEAAPLGGRVRIAAANPNALAAVHEFLRYQIREHRTGDPLTVDE